MCQGNYGWVNIISQERGGGELIWVTRLVCGVRLVGIEVKIPVSVWLGAVFFGYIVE